MFQGVKDIILMPLLAVIMIGASMLIVNIPFAFMNIGIGMGIEALATNYQFLVVLIGALVCALMGIDMGGPINKATHYAVVMVLTNALAAGDPNKLVIPEQLMAANLTGMMVAPAMISIAS